mgnify:CR=1 FL=1
MTEIYAKPIVDGKFWIVEKDGSKIATLHKKENNKFMLSSKDGEAYFNKKDDFVKKIKYSFSFSFLYLICCYIYFKNKLYL